MNTDIYFCFHCKRKFAIDPKEIKQPKYCCYCGYTKIKCVGGNRFNSGDWSPGGWVWRPLEENK